MLVYFTRDFVKKRRRLDKAVEYKGEQDGNKIVGVENPANVTQEET